MYKSIDRPANPQISVFNQMATELSPHMTDEVIDAVVSFQITIRDSKYDINPTIEDSKTQLKLILGETRYNLIVLKWKMKNQKLLSSFGLLKYQRISDATIWDGLDPEDDPLDYRKIYL